MLSATTATRVSITAGVPAKPEYAGTIHDDDSARRYGYRGALVPGIILYGAMADVVVRSWGLDWVARGTMRSYSRRPVYERDTVAIVSQPVRQDADGLSVEMEMLDAAENVVATASATLPTAAPPVPDLTNFPVLPIELPLRAIEAGGFRPGDRFGSKGETVSAEALRESLKMFGQTWPNYAQDGIIHPTKFTHAAMHSALASYALPTPSIYVSAHTQHLGIANVGASLATSGSVTQAYERKGNYYTDQLHLVLADGRPVALIQRTSIYAARVAA